MPTTYTAHIPLDNDEFSIEVELTHRGAPPSRDDPGSPPEFEIETVRLFGATFSDTTALAIALTPLEVSYRETMRYYNWATPSYREQYIGRLVRAFEDRLRLRFQTIDILEKLEERARVEAEENIDE